MRRSGSWLAFLCVVVTTALVPGTALGSTTRYRVTAHLPTTNVAGEAMRVHGRVWPHTGGTRVRIQVRVPGASSFRTLRTARVHSDGRYHARITASLPGEHRYRVVEPAGEGHRRGASAVERVTVSKWRTIASLPRVPGNYDIGTIEAVPSMNLNGTVFAPALEQRPSPSFNPAWQEYVVDRQCSRLETWVGMSPPEPGTPDHGAEASIRVGPDDGSQTFAMATGVGVDYYGPPHELRLGPDLMSKAGIIQLFIDDDAKIPIGWGNPRVLCSF